MKQRDSIECYISVKNNDGVEVLLLHKDKTYRHPDFYQPVTGGIEIGETPLMASLREVFEETGISVLPAQIIDLDYKFEIMLYDEDLLIRKELFMILLNEKPDINISDEHIGFMWVKLEDVKQFLYWDSNKGTFYRFYNEVG